MLDWLTFANSDTPSQGETQLSIEEKEEEFNNVVRENIIALLTFIVLYIVSYWVIVFLHQKRERDERYGGEDEAKVYRISLYQCAVTFAVSMSAVMMLPMSMIGNEIVHLFPGSYWVQWLNGALIHNLWNWTYILSNISLFVLLPFSYFFTESEGFSGQRRGLLPRVYETLTVLFLLAVVVFGLAVLALAFFDSDTSGLELIKMVGEYYAQYLYSFLLCCSVIVMVSCAPFGFILLFDMVGKLLVKPKILENNEEQITATRYEEDTLRRKLHSHNLTQRSRQDRESLRRRMEEAQSKRKQLERRQKASAWERNLGYPLTMLLIILLTGLALFLVVIHILELAFIGDNELHPNKEKGNLKKDYRSYADWNQDSSRQSRWPLNEEQTNQMAALGATSLSTFGIVGTFLEAFVVCYLMLASVVGLYNLPGIKRMRPKREDTSMTGIIFNCVTMQLLSSSLPVLCRILGITEFVLQGNYGEFSWLGNFYIVYFCNFAFAGFTAFCLVQKLTMKMRSELYKALGLDDSQSWASRWLKKHSKEASPGRAASPRSDTKSSSSEIKSSNKNNENLEVTTGLIVEKLEEIDKLSSEFSCENHDQHDVSLPKENGITGR